MRPWLHRRGLHSCVDGGLEFLETRQAEELLERAEEHLDDPPQPIDLRDEFGRQIEPIRDQAEHTVAVRPQHFRALE
jgi:hypothetical protein